jgi:hypothetical protein
MMTEEELKRMNILKALFNQGAENNISNQNFTPNVQPALESAPVPIQQPRRASRFFARGGGFQPDATQQTALDQGFFNTQAEADAYSRQQNSARNRGIGNMLMSVGDAFAGRNIGAEAQTRQANAMQMRQADEARQKQVALNAQIDGMISRKEISPTLGALAKSDPSVLGSIYLEREKNKYKPPVKGPASYEEYIRTDDSPSDAEYAVFLENKAKQGATQINMPDMKAKMGIEYAYDQLQKGDERLRDNQNVTDRLYFMDTLLDDPDFETGAMTDAFLPIKSWLVEFGGKDQNYIENLGNQQLFDALSSYIVPRMRAVGSGATSDFEADLYTKAIASLGKTKEANRLIVKFMLATVERDRKMLELQKRYVAEHDEILGFNAALRDENSGYVEAELFRKFDMETNEDTGATDFQQAVANGDIKIGDLYYDRKAKQMRIYGSEPIPGGPTG